MNAQHTPGPWRHIEANPTVTSGRRGAMGSIPFIANITGDAPKLEQNANARLIAAAPELLQCLVDVMDYWEERVEHDATWEVAVAARKAIAKAKGVSREKIPATSGQQV